MKTTEINYQNKNSKGEKVKNDNKVIMNNNNDNLTCCILTILH